MMRVTYSLTTSAAICPDRAAKATSMRVAWLRPPRLLMVVAACIRRTIWSGAISA
jgi:hypothetical protein